MDLVSFVTGIGATGSFTPGAGTPSPFNVPQIGMVDGSDPTTASNTMAEVFNRLLLQVASVIVNSGLSIDNTNWAQLPAAIRAIVSSMISSAGLVTTTQYGTDFTNSLVVNGFADFKGGLILHWGSLTCPGGGTDITISLSPAFPTACLGVVCASGDSSKVLAVSSSTPPTASSVTLNNGGNTGFYVAIGH